jgi:hypothetical protein
MPKPSSVGTRNVLPSVNSAEAHKLYLLPQGKFRGPKDSDRKRTPNPSRSSPHPQQRLRPISTEKQEQIFAFLSPYEHGEDFQPGTLEHLVLLSRAVCGGRPLHRDCIAPRFPLLACAASSCDAHPISGLDPTLRRLILRQLWSVNCRLSSAVHPPACPAKSVTVGHLGPC